MENKKLIVRAPEGATEVLLHTCCAPCSSAIIECLLNSGIRPTVFYCNPNIHPVEEYLKRRDECTRYADGLSLEVVEDDYDHACWLESVKGLETEPERGGRCLQCFRMRLCRTASYAARHGFKVITTTLASSRWKDIEQIDAAGRWAVEKVNAVLGREAVIWWDRNWRKDGLQVRRSEIIKEMNFYNQTWCGCEFSRRERQ